MCLSHARKTSRSSRSVNFGDTGSVCSEFMGKFRHVLVCPCKWTSEGFGSCGINEEVLGCWGGSSEVRANRDNEKNKFGTEPDVLAMQDSARLHFIKPVIIFFRSRHGLRVHGSGCRV